MFSAFKKFGKLGALASSVARAWSPLALWPDGIATPGMWISPRDLTSQWQDSAGTTPVATPGTVADSANPVGLALDIRAGATVLTDPGNHMLQSTSAARPLMSARVNLLQYTENFNDASWSGSGNAGSDLLDFAGGPDKYQVVSVVVGVPYLVEFDYSLVSGSDREFGVQSWGPDGVVLTATSAVQRYSGVHTFASATGYFVFTKVAAGSVFRISKMSLSHGSMDVEYQAILTDGSSYSSTGFPIAQKYDGVDDGMATAAFSAGTLIDGMDCMIVVRRDSAADSPLGICGDIGGGKFTGFVSVGDYPSNNLCGTPTVWVNNVQVAGGTNVRQNILNAAVPVGGTYILEIRDLDLSGWDRVYYGFGLNVPAYIFNGARGDILLYPSTTPTEDKDAARQWLADYYGVTLP